MSTHCHLWLEYSDDWRGLRDFLFDACHCTRFWTGPMTRQEGRPDDREREHYGVYNDYNLIELIAPRAGSSYNNDVCVFFTFNGRKDDPNGFRNWWTDVIAASVGWLARTTGDALLDLDGLPLVGRGGNGPITVNDFARRTVEWERWPEYRALIAAGLEREGLPHRTGPLDPI